MSELKQIDISNGLPDLSEAKVAGFSINSDYWTPKEGDVKRLVFLRYEIQELPSLRNPEKMEDVECAVFGEKVNGIDRLVANGAARLVSTLKAAETKEGTPFEITYIGKEKNKTNQYSSDVFDVKPIIL